MSRTQLLSNAYTVFLGGLVWWLFVLMSSNSYGVVVLAEPNPWMYLFEVWIALPLVIGIGLVAFVESWRQHHE